MELQVNIKSKQLILDNWELLGYSKPSNWVRRLIPDDKFSCIGLQVSWKNLSAFNDEFVWRAQFLGPDLHVLTDIYYQFYPSPQPYYACDGGCNWRGQCQCVKKYYPSLSPPLITYKSNELEKAKQHLDNFIKRVNKLKIFL